MRELCASGEIAAVEGASVTDLFKRIRESHPAFKSLGPRSDDIVRVLRALASILDTLCPLRNMTSVAHPNAVLLPEPEAVLAINAAHSIFQYLDEKVHRKASAVEPEPTGASDNPSPDLEGD
jgi:hypothetical protein